jgi:hypothetical protein
VKALSKLVLLASLGLVSVGFAKDGCLWKDNGVDFYLQIGAERLMDAKDMMCSKLPTGEYIWVEANAFDLGGGCWFEDKYPNKAIIDDFGLRQCQYLNGHWQWVAYKPKTQSN